MQWRTSGQPCREHEELVLRLWPLRVQRCKMRVHAVKRLRVTPLQDTVVIGQRVEEVWSGAVMGS